MIRAAIGERKFSRIAAQAFVWVVAGNAVNFFVPAAPIALVVNILCIWRLYKAALEYAGAGAEGFDSTVAAEAIVGLGIMSLVFGLATVALLFATGGLEVQTASGEARFEGAIPFIEGLLTAGMAPFFAILLRLNVAEQGESVNSADDMASLSRAASSLARTLAAANVAVDQFQFGASAAATTTSSLASVMEKEVSRWGAALQEGGVATQGFGSTARTATGEIAELSDQTAKLRSAVSDATNLLDELGRLIVSVERFVAPSSAKSRL
jgi:hypothetical protein